MFRQVAQGKFEVAVSGPFHCGPDDTSPKQFDYEVMVCYPDGALDGNGFLLDNLYFEHYFNTIGECTISCERLTRKCAEDIAAATGGRCNKVCVGIWGIPGRAKIECEIN